VPQMQAIGLRYYRASCTGWAQVEPEQGRFEWKALDEHMSYLARHGFIFGGLLNGGVKWNTLDAPGTLPVNNLPAWSNYVSQIVTHCKSRIKRWEVWNEPPNGTGRDQTAADYAKIVIASYNAAKKADPTCLVGLAAKSAHIHYLEQTILAGAKDHFDYITLHPYEVLDGIAGNKGTESVFIHIVPTLRKMLRAHNPAKANVPVVFTELGCDAVKKGADTQAHALVKAYAMGIAQGVASIQWFEGLDGDSGPLGLLDRKGTPRPAYAAMARMIEHLGQRPEYLGWLLLNRKHYAFVFEGAKGSVLITWAYRGESDDLHLPQPVKLLDPLNSDLVTSATHTLTATPVMILGVHESLLAEAKANQSKPLQWGGDYSQAESVSITMGEKQVERGLHTLSGDTLAQAVVAYGGSARSGNLPGGNLFVVDPAFMSYTTEPVEITAVVRRNEANDNAGFKLVYESTSGFKTAKPGWFTIPDNQQWHTIRWQIEDARFVNYWGYNFALESDGSQYNKYYLQSVTVRKTR
jgi:polysaccharide biosynthesis protein PslG